MATGTRNYPRDSLARTLVISQKITDENAGAPMNRLLVADALGIKPSSSNFKYLLSSSRSYGLTEGTEKATEVSLTSLGKQATKAASSERTAVLRQAVLKVPMFKAFFERFDGNKMPSTDMLNKILVADFGVAGDRGAEAADLLTQNGEFVGIIRKISGSPHVMLNGASEAIREDSDSNASTEEDDDAGDDGSVDADMDADSAATPANQSSPVSKPIFLGHGKKRGPLEKLEKLLTGFQIPFKVAVDEANLGRPIPGKVRDLILECGSAILIFTKDEKFTNEDGEEVWRPSENVAHEFGACSFAYEDRVVIFKERGITLPTNYSSIGYIEFEEDGIEAKTAELLQELIGFGLVKITPTG